MPTVEHSTLTSSNLHEPKGADTAAAGQVYVANGSGSGAWTSPIYTISATIADVSSASTVYVPVPYVGNVLKVVSVLSGAITVANATVTVKDSDGNSMGTITVAYSGSAAGDVDTLTPASNQDVTADDYITIETDGGSTDAASLYFTIVMEKTS